MKVPSTFTPSIENMAEQLWENEQSQQSFKKEQHYSIFSAYTVNGYIT